MLIKDLVTVTKNAPWLPKVLSASEPSDLHFRNQYSEEAYIKDKPVNATQLVKAVVMGQGAGDRSQVEVFDVGDYKHNDETWFFVNGVCTDRSLATFNAGCLSRLFERRITVIHNPTHGIVSDLAECVFERTFDKFCVVSRRLYSEVIGHLFDGKRVRVIGHSQGGIIVGRLLKQLKGTELQVFKNLEVYTFASGADEAVNVKGVRQEHFANSDDFVSRIGILSFQPAGDVYVRDSVGHLLNRDYLEHFVGGGFCGKTSRLYSVLRQG